MSDDAPHPTTRTDPDDDQVRLRAAIGQAVLGAAALEHVLRIAILHLRGERDGVDDDLGHQLLALSDKPGGRLRGELETLEFDPELLGRIADVMDRRNRLVHHPGEDLVLTPGLMGRDVEATIAQVNRIAGDCDALVDEILEPALDGALDVMGASAEQLEDFFRNRDLEQIENARARATLATLREILANDSATAPDSGDPATAPRTSEGA